MTLPNHGPATPADRPVMFWTDDGPPPNVRRPAVCRRIGSPADLADDYTADQLADLYWSARCLPGETCLLPTGGIEHGPRSRIIHDAVAVALEEQTR